MWNRIKKYFWSGLVVLIPGAATAYIVYLLFVFADGLLGKYLRPLFDDNFGFYVYGLSILVAALIIIIIGFFATNFFGRRIVAFYERLIVKLPVFRQVYPALKEIAIFLFSRDQLKSFRQVVMIEYPRKGVYCLAFLTNESSQQMNDKVHEELCNVFVPSSPSPITGFTYLIPKKDVIFTDIKIEEAFRFIVSGGVVNPF